MTTNVTIWSVAAGVVSGVVSFVVSRLVWERFRRNQLIRALLVEAVATLHRFDSISDALAEGARQPRNGIAIDIERVRSLYCGFILSKPIELPLELVWLLRTNYAVNVVHFYDSWNRFLDFEARYVALHDKLLVAASSTPPQPAALLEEYWDQAISILVFMNEIASRLCYYACLLFRNLGPNDDDRVAEFCQGRWKNWAEANSERQKWFAKYRPTK